jgi:hypothetical protein
VAEAQTTFRRHAGPYETEREAANSVRHVTASPAEAWGARAAQAIGGCLHRSGSPARLLRPGHPVAARRLGAEHGRRASWDHRPRARERGAAMSDESIRADLARLRDQFPGWRFGTVWATAASGPDRRRVWAVKDGIVPYCGVQPGQRDQPAPVLPTQPQRHRMYLPCRDRRHVRFSALTCPGLTQSRSVVAERG